MTREYPRTLQLGDMSIDVRPMGPQDSEAIRAFALELPRHDLLFLRRDITSVEAVDAWIRDIDAGSIRTLLARVDSKIVGYATMHRKDLEWQRHVAELRMAVAAPMRGKGLGRLLTQEIFALALESGVEKLMARMTVDQKGALSTFEGLGFRPEALMHDHVKDREGRTHDLVVMSHAVADFEQKLNAYGVAENLGA